MGLQVSRFVDAAINIQRNAYVLIGSTKPQHRKLPMPIMPDTFSLSKIPIKPLKIVKNLFKFLDEANKIALKITFKSVEKYFGHFLESSAQNFRSAPKNSVQYIQNIVDISKNLTLNEHITVKNAHNLDKIIKNNEPCIFIMNHGNYTQDAFGLAKLSEVLYGKSLHLKQGEQCPRPNIIINRDVLDSQPHMIRELFDNLGCVGVDATFYHPSSEAKLYNKKQLLPVMRDFTQGKNHIFIFPEGGLGTYTNHYPLEKRFQIGVGNMAKIIADNQNGKVNIIPIGFHHNTHSAKTSTNIVVGTPICIKKENNQYYSTAGNITAENTSENFKEFFYGSSKPSQYKVIKNGNEKIPEHLTERYISGILAENLKIVMAEAGKINSL